MLAGCERDHSAGQVDPHHSAAGLHALGQQPSHVAGPTSQVENRHARSGPAPFEHEQTSARLAAGHDLVEPRLVGLGVAAEDHRVELLGSHAAGLRHSRSSHIAAASAPALVRPTTWMPTGNPFTGAGNETTGWPVRLNGRVYRASGSRASMPAVTRGATVAVVGRINASTSDIAASAAACRPGRAVRASS